MRRLFAKWKILLPLCFVGAGIALIVLAFAADLVGAGTRGSFGRTQVVALVAGLAIALVGGILVAPPGQRYLLALSGTDAQPVGPLSVASWFGLFAGWGETLWLVREYARRRPIYMGLDYLWMVPLTNLLLFATVGLILSALRRRCPKLISLWAVTFVSALLAYLNLLLLIERLHDWAALLLSAGLAVQTARIAAKHSPGFGHLVRYTLGWPILLRKGWRQRTPPADSQDHSGPKLSRRDFLIGGGSAIAGAAIVVRGGGRLAETRHLAALPQVSQDMPNVLLIVLDTVRAQSLSLHGYHRPTTPNLEQWAQNGVLFERAIAPAPWTLPTHASMFTGRWPHELSTSWTMPLDAAYPTLAEVLSAHGYATAGFVANLSYCTHEFGLDRGFAHYEDYVLSPGQFALSSSLARTVGNNERLRYVLNNHEILNRKSAEATNDDFLSWLPRRNRQPFFAFLNYYDAHAPYLPPSPFDVKFGPKRGRAWFMHTDSGADRRDQWKMSPEEIQAERDAYDGAIAYVDQQLDSLLGELQQRGLLQNTVVIVTSDHGEEFGEHGVFGHGNSMYLPSLHVPLMVSYPSHVPSDGRVREPVSLRDLPATVMDLVGLGAASHFPGRSLARYWNDSEAAGLSSEMLLSETDYLEAGQAWYPTRKGAIKSLLFGEMHYIVNEGDGREELYDIESDPWETQDLAATETGRRWLERFRTSLELILADNRGST